MKFQLAGSLSEVLLDRFTVENVEDTAGANRFDLWANGWDLFGHSSPFRQILGYGTASIRECFRTFNYHPVSVMHNIFLEMLVELGVIGFLLYTGTTVAFAVYAFKLKDKFSLAVLVCMIVLSLSTSLYTFKPHYNIMMYILICTNTHVAAEREGANLIEDK